MSEYSKGDPNADGIVDILDIILTVQCILYCCIDMDCELWAMDIDEDGSVGVLDIVMIVNIMGV